MSREITTQYVVNVPDPAQVKGELDKKLLALAGVLKANSNSDSVSLTTETTETSMVVQATFISPAIGLSQEALSSMLKNVVDGWFRHERFISTRRKR